MKHSFSADSTRLFPYFSQRDSKVNNRYKSRGCVIHSVRELKPRTTSFNKEKDKNHGYLEHVVNREY